MPFLNFATIVGGLILASGAAAGVLALLFVDIRVFPWAFAIVVTVAFCLGLPLYGLARKFNKVSWRAAISLGFLVGALLPASTFFGAPDQASVGGVATVVNGSYTLAGWLRNIAFSSFFGLLGSGAGFLFWLLVRRRPSPKGLDKQGPKHETRRAFIIWFMALGLICGAVIIPYATADRSCHNPLRGGGDGISPVATFRLKVQRSDWLDVAAELNDFAQEFDWSVRSDVRPEAKYPWFQISLCQEPGLNIFIGRYFNDGTLRFSVYDPERVNIWQRSFGRLYRRIEARWPGRTGFKDLKQQPIEVPTWAQTPNE